jgi:hypothetical protein
MIWICDSSGSVAGSSARHPAPVSKVFQVYAQHRIVEDSTMDTRRFRNFKSMSLEQLRWLGWVAITMFVLVQSIRPAIAAGSDSSASSERSSPLANADFNRDTHQVSLKAFAPTAMWDLVPDIGRRSFVVYEGNVRQDLVGPLVIVDRRS